MNNAQYISLQNRLMLIADIVRVMDLDSFLARIELAHALGPICDPSLYAKAHEQLQAIERLARAAKALKSEAEKPPFVPKVDDKLLQFLNAALS